MTFTTKKKYFLKEKDFFSVALVTMASQLSVFREKKILRDYEAKLTPPKKLESLDLFLWHHVQNLSGLGGPKSIYAAEGTFWRVLLHTAVHALEEP